MSDYHVVRYGDGWADRRENADRVSGKYETQAEAATAAKAHAINSGGGEVTIHGRDGKIRESNTYGKNDPFPPRG